MAQKTLISLITTAAAELNLPAPVTVLSNQDQSIQKLVTFARAVCDDLLAEHDWQVLQTRYTFSTTPGQEAYPFPTDIERYIDGTFFDKNNRWPLQGPKRPGEWEWLKASSYVGTPFTQFRVYGSKFYVSPVPATGSVTFNMEYISNNVVRDASGTYTKADFTQDSDICLFDHRVVVYGIKLKFRQSIGQDTSATLTDYKRALELSKGSDIPGASLSLLGGSTFRMLSNDNIPDGSWS